VLVGGRLRYAFGRWGDTSLKPVVAFFAFLFAACNPALADPMTLDFPWRGAHGCVTLFPNPEIRLRNIPVGAKLLYLTLTQDRREMGGTGDSRSGGRRCAIRKYQDIWSL
jgi:hypothetical protein